MGDADARSRDVLGRVYEYFLAQFASAEGKKGGEFYTPRCVVKVLIEMLEPYRGRVYDPVLWLVGDVRAIDQVRPRPCERQRQWWEGQGGHQHLRPGVELHDVAAREDEPPRFAASRGRSPTATASTTTATRTSRPTSSSPTRHSTSRTGAATA